MRRIKIFDTTLRDGEQSPGIALQPHEKAEIARSLESLGVDVIEAGFAASSPGDHAGVAAVACAVSTATVASLCRTTQADIDASVDALQGAGRSRLHIFMATSPLHMQRKLGLEPSQVLERIRWAIAYARERADEVEFSAEDATRSEPEFLAEACRTAIAAGADVVNLPDTVGYALPDELTRLLTEVRSLCPELDGVELSVHCHDDLGLAVANSLAGLAAGATQVECTINGLGERAGNAALEEIVVALRVRDESFATECNIDMRHLHRTSRLVSALTGYVVQPNKAVVGANAFAHEAGIHQDGVLKDASTYQIIDPAELGLTMTLPLGKHSGRHAFARACTDAGLELDREQVDSAFARFKRLADGGDRVSLSDVFQEVAA
ncbi:MAG: 2-isopropylmalate synthase [Gaiellaceae bacterium]